MAISRQTRFQFARHVFMCQLAGSTVLLDLKRDRYWGIEAAEFQALLPYLAGHAPSMLSSGSGSATEPALLATLIAEGMLVDEHQTGNFPYPPVLMPPQGGLIEGYDESATRIRFPDVARLLFAAAIVHTSLKLYPLHRIIDAFRASHGDPNRSFPCDLDTMRMCVAAYRRMRLFLFTANNACLFDSLVLARFLRLHGFFPRLVFGVKTSPFAAHCWLQQDDIVINDMPETVRNYTPIMAI